MGKLQDIAELVLDITDKELADTKKEIEDQCNYTHPLKSGTAARIRKIGEHNKLIMAKIEELKAVVEDVPKGVY